MSTNPYQSGDEPAIRADVATESGLEKRFAALQATHGWLWLNVIVLWHFAIGGVVVGYLAFAKLSGAFD